MSDVDMQRAIFASIQAAHQQAFAAAARFHDTAFSRSGFDSFSSMRSAGGGFSRRFSSGTPSARRQSNHSAVRRSTSHRRIQRSNASSTKFGHGRVSTMEKEGIRPIATSSSRLSSSQDHSQNNRHNRSSRHYRSKKQTSGALGQDQWEVNLEEARREKPDRIGGSSPQKYTVEDLDTSISASGRKKCTNQRNSSSAQYTIEDLDSCAENDDDASSLYSTDSKQYRSRTRKPSRNTAKVSRSSVRKSGANPSHKSHKTVIDAKNSWLEPWTEKLGRGTMQKHHNKAVLTLKSTRRHQIPYLACFQEDALEDIFHSACFNLESHFKFMESSDKQMCSFIINYKAPDSHGNKSFTSLTFSAAAEMWRVERHTVSASGTSVEREILFRSDAVHDYYKTGKWNHVMIEIRGAHCTLFFNNHPIFENIRTCTNSKEKNDGHIGFSVSTTHCALKNWKVKEGSEVPHDQTAVPRSLPVGIDRAMADQIRNDIILKDLNVKWDDIAELGDAKRLLHEAVVLPMIIPECFNGLRQPWAGVLLYGPPGTGKTLLAKAVSCQAKSTFFNVSASTLMSKYLGESEKMIRTLFEMARHYAPSVIFFDEVDSIISKRGRSSEHEASRRLKSELLSQMDGINSQTSEEGKHVMVLATTNRPWDLDSAIVRRLEKRIYVPLPDVQGRKACFEIFLRDVDQDRQLNYEKLAAESKGYSGADIKLLCRDASMMPMRRALQGKDVDEIMKMKAAGELSFGISQEDFEEPFKKIRPSVGNDDHAQYEKWTREYGSL